MDGGIKKKEFLGQDMDPVELQRFGKPLPRHSEASVVGENFNDILEFLYLFISFFIDILLQIA